MLPMTWEGAARAPPFSQIPHFLEDDLIITKKNFCEKTTKPIDSSFILFYLLFLRVFWSLFNYICPLRLVLLCFAVNGILVILLYN